MEKDTQIRYADNQVLFSYSLRNNICPQKNTFAPHSHDICELLLFISGNVSYSTRGYKYKLKPYDLIISRPSEIHKIEIMGECNYERYNILYDEKNLPFEFFKKIPATLDVINVYENPSVVKLFEKMQYYCERLSGAERAAILSNIAQEIIVNIMLEVESNAQDKGYVTTNPIVRAAIDYIDKNFLTLSDIDEICSSLYITKSHLHHLFVKHMGISPKKYVTTKKLVYAEREIFSGAKPTEIYTKCGFNDYSTFYRAYRSHFGRSPSDKTSAPISIEKSSI